MRVGPYQFKPSWIPTLATVPMLGLLLWLGMWQLERAESKQVLIDAKASFAGRAPANVTSLARDSKPLRHQRMSATGRYIQSRQFLLDNRTRNGQAGYYVMTPLELGDGTILIVSRGWVPTGFDRTKLPDIAIAQNEVNATATGHVHHPAEEQLLLGPAGYAQSDWPRVVQRVEFASMADALTRIVRPFTLRLDQQATHGYQRQWPTHYGITPDRHQAYSFQWFSLAAALLTIYFVVNTRKVTSQ